jgi:hypothetical protein
MNSATLRLRYTQFFIVCLLGISLYTMAQSLLAGGGQILQFESHLWGRQSLVTSFTNLRLTLGDRVFLQAVVGKDGWLEYTRSRNLDGYQNAIGTTPKALKNTQQKVQELYEELRKKNITLILVIPPNKATIYPDKLPNEIQKLNPQSKLEIFTAYLQQHGPPVLVDLRPALLNGREQRDVYYKTDTHWNQYGAFIGYAEIMKELSKTYPQLAPRNIEDFNITISRPGARDISRIIGATNLLEPVIVFSPKKKETLASPTANLPVLLMYMDSFGNRMKDFISRHFGKATFIPIGSNNRKMSFSKTLDTIKPNIVIVELVERSFNIQKLDTFLNQILSNPN